MQQRFAFLLPPPQDETKQNINTITFQGYRDLALYNTTKSLQGPAQAPDFVRS